MLSLKEKKEMLRDGLSKRRRQEFRKDRTLTLQEPIQTLDEYIKFLMDIQKIFSPFVPLRKKTETKFNKL